VKRLYAAHRWLAAIAFLQLLIWTGSGLFFALAPMKRVRGEDRKSDDAAPIRWDGVVPPPHGVVAEEVTLRMVDGRPMYLIRTREGRLLFDGRTGDPMEIDGDAAGRIARADQLGMPTADSVERIVDAPVEYRGKPLPAWRVHLADGRGTRIYVDALSGTVTARRNDLWRAFDFLWSLHVMDYRAREDTNSLLLTAFAMLGVVTVLSGGVLWAVRLRRRFARSRQGA
jgi:hypothetical protein